LRCWGANDFGQLGNGMTDRLYTPPMTDVATNLRGIVIGDMHTCGLNGNGGVICWGNNGYGQLGDGTANSRSTPGTVSALGNVSAKALAAGLDHTCALTVAGGVRCWGDDSRGQLGAAGVGEDPLFLRRSTPTNDVITNVQAIAAGENFTCALLL